MYFQGIGGTVMTKTNRLIISAINNTSEIHTVCLGPSKCCRAFLALKQYNKCNVIFKVYTH